MHIFISIIPISQPIPTFDHLLELSHMYDSNKWSNLGRDEEMSRLELIEVHLTYLIWSSVYTLLIMLTGSTVLNISKLKN